MAASPSLSHSSQDKAWKQGEIKWRQEVSDECGGGMQMVVPDHKAYIHQFHVSINQGESLGCGYHSKI